MDVALGASSIDTSLAMTIKLGITRVRSTAAYGKSKSDRLLATALTGVKGMRSRDLNKTQVSHAISAYSAARGVSKTEARRVLTDIGESRARALRKYSR